MHDSPVDGSTPAAAQGDPPPAVDGIDFPESFDLPAEFTAERATEKAIAAATGGGGAGVRHLA